MFKDFGRRLQRDIKKLVDTRMQANIQRLQAVASARGGAMPPAIDVQVTLEGMRECPCLVSDVPFVVSVAAVVVVVPVVVICMSALNFVHLPVFTCGCICAI